MQYLLSDAEIKAIYKKMERDNQDPENKDVKQNDKVPYLSQAIQKALGLIGY